MPHQRKSSSRTATIVSIVSTLVAVGTLTDSIVARRSNQALQVEIEKAKIAADQARDRERIAREQLASQQKLGATQSWMSLVEHALDGETLKIAFKNVGTTPAVNVSMRSGIRLEAKSAGLSQEAISRYLDEDRMPLQKSVIAPGEVSRTNRMLSAQSWIEDANHQSSALYSVGDLKYSDVFGRHHKLQWCYVYYVSTHEFDPCPLFNVAE
jgi:hypothetical protein